MPIRPLLPSALRGALLCLALSGAVQAQVPASAVPPVPASGAYRTFSDVCKTETYQHYYATPKKPVRSWAWEFNPADDFMPPAFALETADHLYDTIDVDYTEERLTHRALTGYSKTVRWIAGYNDKMAVYAYTTPDPDTQVMPPPIVETTETADILVLMEVQKKEYRDQYGKSNYTQYHESITDRRDGALLGEMQYLTTVDYHDFTRFKSCGPLLNGNLNRVLFAAKAMGYQYRVGYSILRNMEKSPETFELFQTEEAAKKRILSAHTSYGAPLVQTSAPTLIRWVESAQY